MEEIQCETCGKRITEKGRLKRQKTEFHKNFVNGYVPETRREEYMNKHFDSFYDDSKLYEILTYRERIFVLVGAIFNHRENLHTTRLQKLIINI